jgi:Ni,Fe-hydrogenase III large subunit
VGGVSRIDLVNTATVTDEQIRKLNSDAMKWVRAHGPTTASWDRRAYLRHKAIIYSTRVALAECRAKRGDSRSKARVRCAEAIASYDCSCISSDEWIE